MPTATTTLSSGRRPRAAAFLFALGLTVVGTASAIAAPVSFDTSTYTTLAQASAGGAADGPAFATSAATPLPLASSAAVPNAGNGTAAATASAEAALLTVESSAAAGNGAAQATAVGTFLGEFVAPGGQLVLTLDFASTSDPGGAGAATVIVTLFVDGTPVYEDVIAVAGLYETTFDAAAGSAGVLELTLNGETLTSAGGVGNNLAELRFGIADAPTSVPEPSVLALLLIAPMSVGLAAARRRRTDV